jgi:hypothetical protein
MVAAQSNEAMSFQVHSFARMNVGLLRTGLVQLFVVKWC